MKDQVSNPPTYSKKPGKHNRIITKKIGE